MLLYEALTGGPPYRGVSALESVHLMLSEEPLPPSRLRPGLPRDLETICLHCLQKEPHKRYSTAGQLAEDLECFLTGEPIRARRQPGKRLEVVATSPRDRRLGRRTRSDGGRRLRVGALNGGAWRLSVTLPMTPAATQSH